MVKESNELRYLLKQATYPLLDEDDMASNSATSAASQQSIKAYVDNNSPVLVNIVPPFEMGGYSGFSKTSCWIVLNADTEAYIHAHFIIETTGTYRVNFVFRNGGNANDESGVIRMGASQHDEAFSTTNILNDENCDLDTTAQDDVCFHEHASDCSLEAGDQVEVRWKKDANEGGDNLSIYVIYLERQ